MLRDRIRDLVRAAVQRPVATLWWAAASSLVLRVLLVLLRGTWTSDFSSSDIGSIAYRIAAGEGFTFAGMPSSFFGPVYLYLWAFALRAWGEGGQLAIQLLQAVLLSVTPVLVYSFARLRFAVLPALCGGLILAFYPELLALPTTMYADTLAMSLWCADLALYAATVRAGPRSVRAAIALGLCTGVMALTKGRMLLFSALLLPFLAAGDPASFRRLLRPSAAGLRAVALAVLGIAVALAPWAVRNARVHGELLLLESTSGFNLWLGHNENATGTGKMRAGVGGAADPDDGGSADTGFPRSPELQAALRAARTEPERDAAFRRAAALAIRADPAREIGLSLRKALYFWTIDPTSLVARSPAYWGPWAGAVALFAVGVRARVRGGDRDPLLAAVLISATALAVAYFVIPRLRYPVYPVVFLLAGQGLASLLVRAGLAPAGSMERR